MTVGAVVVTSLLGKDPWGGAGLNADTLAAVGTGLAAALPLAALRMWSWTPAAAQAVPALQVCGRGRGRDRGRGHVGLGGRCERHTAVQRIVSAAAL